MTPNEERGALEVPDALKGGQDLCPKCFEMVAVNGPGCMDPDCPMADDLEAGPDSTVYPELAKANLYRMRGEYKLARDTCLSLLKRYPNNADAHTLLGDIEAEEGDLVHAAEWYEMALDLKPEAEMARAKLDALKKRMKDHEVATTAEQLGLPTSRPRALVFASVIVVFIVLVGAVAFALGDRLRARRQPAPAAVTTPIEFAADTTATTKAADTPVVEKTAPVEPEAREVESTPPVVTGPVEDIDLQRRLSAQCVEGSRILFASEDPRDKTLTLTATAGNAGEDDREIAALLGVSALEQATGAPRVIVRLMHGNELAFMADVTRETMTAARSQIGELGIGKHDREALVAVLSNVWPQ